MTRRMAWVIGAAAILMGLITSILMLVLAVALNPSGRRYYALLLAAAIVQLLSCGILAAVIVCKLHLDQSFGNSTFRYHIAIVLLGAFPSVVAIAVVGAALGWSEANIVNRNLRVLGILVSTFLSIIFVFWGISILAHIACFFSLAWLRGQAPKPLPQEFAVDEGPQEMIEPSRPATTTTIRSNPFREQIPSSPPSLIASDGTSSLRSSFSTTNRPSSSKKGLLIRQHSYTRQSRRSSSDGPSGRPSQDEGFNSWDTSAVSYQIRETVLQSKPLEPSKSCFLRFYSPFLVHILGFETCCGGMIPLKLSHDPK